MTDEIQRASARTPAACLPKHLQKPRLNTTEASEYLLAVHGLRVAPATLSKLRSVGGGPAYQRALRTPLYHLEILNSWAETRLGALRNTTSDTGA